MRKIKSLIVFLIFNTFVFSEAYAGYLDFSCKTPGSNEINDFRGYAILELKNGEEIKNLTSWYFYKNYIIGKANNSRLFFAVNEETFQTYTFESEKTWLEFIEKNELDTKFWKRWYSTDWTIWDEEILYLFVGLPIFLVAFIFFVRAIKLRNFKIQKLYVIVFFITTLIALASYIIERFPQSI